MLEDLQSLNKDKFCYNGNTKLMKAGTILSYTEEQIREIYRCATDILYFIENYVYIINLDEGLVKFALYPYQREMIKAFQSHRFNICLLSRQMGKCVNYDTNITIKNKKTGETREIKIGDFLREMA